MARRTGSARRRRGPRRRRRRTRSARSRRRRRRIDLERWKRRRRRRDRKMPPRKLWRRRRRRASRGKPRASRSPPRRNRRTPRLRGAFASEPTGIPTRTPKVQNERPKSRTSGTPSTPRGKWKTPPPPRPARRSTGRRWPSRVRSRTRTRGDDSRRRIFPRSSAIWWWRIRPSVVRARVCSRRRDSGMRSRRIASACSRWRR